MRTKDFTGAVFCDLTLQVFFVDSRFLRPRSPDLTSVYLTYIKRKKDANTSEFDSIQNIFVKCGIYHQNTSKTNGMQNGD